ncbi:hypothetical protein HDU96_000020 [Phlyctochytrium bullatum]|nr:hypothetical protein HDU96_000020 [Phlyctochytrium bullatum]
MDNDSIPAVADADPVTEAVTADADDRLLASPVMTPLPPAELDNELFIENPAWEPSPPSPLTQRLINQFGDIKFKRHARSLSHSVVEGNRQNRQRAISTSTNFTTGSHSQRMQELLAFHQVLEQPARPVVGTSRAAKVKPTQLENLQLSLEMILEHRKIMSPSSPSFATRTPSIELRSPLAKLSLPPTPATPSRAGADVIDAYYTQEPDLEESKAELTPAPQADDDTTSTIMENSPISSDSEDDQADLEMLDQMAIAALAAAQRTREHAVTIAMRGVGVSDAEVAAAAIASWQGPSDDAGVPFPSLGRGSLHRHGSTRGTEDARGNPSPVPSHASLSRLSMSLASLSNPRASPTPIASAAPTNPLQSLDKMSTDVHGLVTELTSLEHRLQEEIRAATAQSQPNSALLHAMGLGEYAGQKVLSPGGATESYPSLSRSSNFSADDDADSIFDVTPRNPQLSRTRSNGRSKASRVMGMNEKEEANLHRRSMFPGFTVPALPIDPKPKRSTLIGLPSTPQAPRGQGVAARLQNDSDSDDSILPASMSKKKRPVSTIKALKMMGVREGDLPKSPKSFRPQSMMNPGTSPSSEPSFNSLKSPPANAMSPKAMKVMGLNLRNQAAAAPAAEEKTGGFAMGRRRSVSRNTPSPTNAFAPMQFPSQSSANPPAPVPLSMSRTNSGLSFGSLRGMNLGPRRPSQSTLHSQDDVDYLTDHDPAEDDLAELEDELVNGNDRDSRRSSRRKSTDRRRSKSVVNGNKAFRLMGIDPAASAEPAGATVPPVPSFGRRGSNASIENEADKGSRRRSRSRTRNSRASLALSAEGSGPDSMPRAAPKSGLPTLGALLSDPAARPTIQGYLQKHNAGKMFRQWKKRYFVLAPARAKLYYFESSDPAEVAVGIIPMDIRTDVASARSAQFKGKPVIQISGHVKASGSEEMVHKLWHLMADDEGSKGAWMKELVTAIMGAKPGSLNTSFGGTEFIPTLTRNNVPFGTDEPSTGARRPSLGYLNLGSFGLGASSATNDQAMAGGYLDFKPPSASFKFDGLGASQETLYHAH